MELRPYQQRVIDEIVAHIRAGKKRILVVAPTGSGKTVLSGFIAKGAVAKGNRVQFLVHRDFLLTQTSLTFKRVGIPHGFVAASISKHVEKTVHTHLCSVGTLARKPEVVAPAKIRIWDECHHIVAGQHDKIFQSNPDAIDIGVTATPERLDGKGLGSHFEVMVMGPTVRELMDLGSLSGYQAFSIPSEFDRSALHMRGGEFKSDELEEALDKPRLVGDLVEHYKTHANGKRAVYFAVSIAHSEHIAEAFNAAGIPALHLDGTSSAAERADAARRMADGDLRVLTNCALFGEGFDLGAQAGRDDLTVDCVGLARPTASLSLYLQMVGRALRPKADGGRAVILDHVGNIREHGFPDDGREWSLEGRARKQKDAAPRVWDCPSCMACNPATARECQECGYVRPVIRDGEGRMIDAVEGTLVEMTREEEAQGQEIVREREAAVKAAKKRLWDCVRANDFNAFRREARAQGMNEVKIPHSWEFRRQKVIEEAGQRRRYA
jgi:DNA repair protein RadD